jgi:hypothetical protein
MDVMDAFHTDKDMFLLLANFAKTKKQDPDFTFSLQTDSLNKVDHIFWVVGLRQKATMILSCSTPHLHEKYV